MNGNRGRDGGTWWPKTGHIVEIEAWGFVELEPVVLVDVFNNEGRKVRTSFPFLPNELALEIPVGESDYPSGVDVAVLSETCVLVTFPSGQSRYFHLDGRVVNTQYPVSQLDTGIYDTATLEVRGLK